MSIPAALPDQMVDLYRRIAELERRLANKKRTGLIAEVDAEKGLARVRLSTDPQTGQPYLSPWIPWKEVSMGQIKTHFPPSVGEQVEVVSETGDLTDALIETSIPSNQNARPHDKGGEAMIKNGSTTILITDGEVRITAGKIVLEGATHLGGDGGQLVHRKGDADSDGDTAVGSASKVYAV